MVHPDMVKDLKGIDNPEEEKVEIPENNYYRPSGKEIEKKKREAEMELYDAIIMAKKNGRIEDAIRLTETTAMLIYAYNIGRK
ncbi:MAG: hypothetical protein IJY81_02830 [Lachnospiraceae bacterium]|nr:hypothetical protein [Lachnospiraceae bacterium]MBQ9701330.1 hypothetical protein [Lachnospiraceae bacterium]